MIVVSDTSPLNYLVLIDAIEILPKLFLEIHVPTRVMEELDRPQTPEAVRRWAQTPPEWLHVSTPHTTLAISIRLDAGESQAIALAGELHAKAILIDERKGRRVAEQFGLDAIGTLTVLEFAAERHLLELKTHARGTAADHVLHYGRLPRRRPSARRCQAEDLKAIVLRRVTCGP